MSRRSGQTIAEILIGVAIGALLMVAVSTLISPALQSSKLAATIQDQTELSNELTGNLQAWANGGWSNVLSLSTTSANDYYLIASTSPFIATSGIENVTLGSSTYSRFFYLTDIYRDISGNATTSAVGNAYDFSTKQISVVVGGGGLATSSISFYVTRYGNNAFSQNDWSGGGGQSGVITLAGDSFSTSSFISYASGTLKLAPPGGSCE